MEIGRKIKRLRVGLNLTQEELADRTELSKSFISQVERDLTSPSIATLVDILQALGTDLKEFFDDEPDRQIVFHDSDYFEKNDEEAGILTEWIIPNAQKNEMEPIRVTLKAGARTRTADPHEGELFGYVLTGSIVIHLGQQAYRAKKGESFYFRPASRYYIEAAGKSGASIIWVSTPPNF
jgi:transcriptional regulator with XRE-family HTH domain